jgi:hypothetical protein
VGASTTPAKKQTIVIEQESEQVEQKDINQLYIGLKIIVRGLDLSWYIKLLLFFNQSVGWLRVELMYWAAIMFIRVIQGFGISC